MIFQEAWLKDSLPLTSTAKIIRYNLQIDSVLKKYELTLLVEQEMKFLADLKNALQNQRRVEMDLMHLVREERSKTDPSIIQNASSQSMAKLSALIKIQTHVGDELIKDSKIFVSGTKIYSTMQGVLAVLIGVMVVSIVSASNIVKIQNEKFNLN